jgi:hypothetical protein
MVRRCQRFCRGRPPPRRGTGAGVPTGRAEQAGVGKLPALAVKFDGKYNNSSKFENSKLVLVR